MLLLTFSVCLLTGRQDGSSSSEMVSSQTAYGHCVAVAVAVISVTSRVVRVSPDDLLLIYIITWLQVVFHLIFVCSLCYLLV